MAKRYHLKYLFACCLLMFSFSHLAGQTDSTARPFVLGVIDNIKSVYLNETRTLNIYLPQNYNAADSVNYSVIYLLDGSADEDFIHVAGLVQFNTFPWINRLPATIIVGIANVNRQRDFTFPTTIADDKKTFPATGHSDSFISFIEKELQPFIGKKYKGTGSKMLIGQSLGGLLATGILLEHTSLFDEYVIISPSLWWDNGSLLAKMDSFRGRQQTPKVYLAVGKEGKTPGAKPRNMEEDVRSMSEKISGKVKLFFDYLPEEDHATIAHEAIYRAFKKFNPAVK